MKNPPKQNPVAPPARVQNKNLRKNSPQGINPRALGCEARATQGNDKKGSTLKGLYATLSGLIHGLPYTQGRFATLG